MSDKHIAMEYILYKGPDPVGWFYFAPTKIKIYAYCKPRWLRNTRERVELLEKLKGEE